MFKMFPCYNTPGLVIPAQKKPDNEHSLESGVLEQGNILNMQDGEPGGPGLRTTDPCNQPVMEFLTHTGSYGTGQLKGGLHHHL